MPEGNTTDEEESLPPMNAPPRARRRCVYVCERELALLFIITRIAKNIAKFRFLPGNGLDLHTLFFSRSHPALR